MDSAPFSNGSAIRVIGLCGSLRQGSFTKMALSVALNGAADAGAVVRFLDLQEYDLPLATGVVKSTGSENGGRRLRADVKSADGVILATPDYHGSFSGVLKNALDLMGYEEFEGKMVGLVAVSNGRMGAVDALNGLRNVGRALHAWVVPEQAAVAEAWNAFESSGCLKDSETAERLRRVGQQVALFGRLHKCATAHQFLNIWQEKTVEQSVGKERQPF